MINFSCAFSYICLNDSPIGAVWNSIETESRLDSSTDWLRLSCCEFEVDSFDPPCLLTSTRTRCNVFGGRPTMQMILVGFYSKLEHIVMPVESPLSAPSYFPFSCCFLKIFWPGPTNWEAIVHPQGLSHRRCIHLCDTSHDAFNRRFHNPS